MKGRALLSAGAKPYIAVRIGKSAKVIDSLKEIFI